MAPAQKCAGVFFLKNRARQVCRARSNSRQATPKTKTRPAFVAGRRIGRHSGLCGACACDALTQIEPPPRWAGAGVRCTLLRQVVQMCAAHDADGWPSLHHEGRFTDTPHSLAMKIPRHASTRLPSGAGSVPASRSGPDLASIKAHVGATFSRGCRVDHRSIRASSTPAALACRESWRGHGLRLGLYGGNRPAQQISPTCGLPRETNFLCLPVLHCVAASSLRYAMPPARPSPFGSPTRPRWARP